MGREREREGEGGGGSEGGTCLERTYITASLPNIFLFF